MKKDVLFCTGKSNCRSLLRPSRSHHFIKESSYREKNELRLKFDDATTKFIIKNLNFMMGLPNLITSTDSINPGSNTSEIIIKKVNESLSFTEYELGFLAYWLFRAYTNKNRRKLIKKGKMSNFGKYLLYTLLNQIYQKIHDEENLKMIKKYLIELLEFSQPPNLLIIDREG